MLPKTNSFIKVANFFKATKFFIDFTTFPFSSKSKNQLQVEFFFGIAYYVVCIYDTINGFRSAEEADYYDRTERLRDQDKNYYDRTERLRDQDKNYYDQAERLRDQDKQENNSR